MTVIFKTVTEMDYIVCDIYEEAFAQAAKLKGVETLEIEKQVDYTEEDGDPVVTWVVSAARPIDTE